MPQEDGYPFQNLVELPDGHWARYFCRFVVCNQSILPNSIVAMRVQLSCSDGRWEHAHFRLLQQPGGEHINDFPVTLGPTSTSIIDGHLYMPVAERGSTRNDREHLAIQRLHKNQRVKVDLHCAEGGRFQVIVDVSPIAPDPLARPIAA